MTGDSRQRVVLLHGLGSSTSAWRRVLGLLNDLDCLPLALAGHSGGAALPVGQVGLDHIVADVREQLDELGIDRAHLVGNSLGAWVALRLAQEGRALSVLALAPAGGWSPGGLYERTLRLRFRLGRLIGRLVSGPALRLLDFARARQLLLRPILENGRLLSREEAQGIFEDLARCELLRPGRLVPGTVSPGRLDDPAVPVVVAWSNCDRVLAPFQAATSGLARQVPHARYEYIRDAGHVPMWDAPEIVAELVRASVTSTGHGSRNSEATTRAGATRDDA